uniref:Uncharacterized protein n=1 Tax=Caenorhabditis tropicalis TaxID=1561998 RepID=A0A1I7TU19_9PELO
MTTFRSKEKYSQTLGRCFFPWARERSSKESKRDDYCDLSSFVNASRRWCRIDPPIQSILPDGADSDPIFIHAYSKLSSYLRKSMFFFVDFLD